MDILLRWYTNEMEDRKLLSQVTSKTISSQNIKKGVSYNCLQPKRPDHPSSMEPITLDFQNYGTSPFGNETEKSI